jgi:uncharacterized delta-60 repeat protein
MRLLRIRHRDRHAFAGAGFALPVRSNARSGGNARGGRTARAGRTAFRQSAKWGPGRAFSHRLLLSICLVAVIVPILAAPSINAGGGLDPGFGDGGIVITNLNNSDFSYAVALQSDGKIVTAGTSNFGFALIRYNPDGALDRTFGSGGTVLEYFGRYNLAYGLAIQPDGKILAAGYQQNGLAPGPDFSVTPLIVKYNPDGSRDSGFGNAGVAAVNLGGVDSARSLAIQPDGKILLAGNDLVAPDIVGAPSKFVIARLNPDGGLDQTFGSAGKISTWFGQADFLNTAVLQTDGKIIAVGDTGPAGSADDTEGRSIALARYNADGSLDQTFGSGGKVMTLVQGGAITYSASLQSDGKLIVAGTSGGKLTLARYNPDGTLDSKFGAGGVVSSIDGEGHSVALQPDGKIVVGGSASNGANDEFALLRFNADGSPDASFGANGVAAMDLGLSCEGSAIAIEPDGRIIMAGYVQKNPSSVAGTRFAVMSYQPASSNRCMRDSGTGDYVVFNPDGQYKFAICGKTEMTLSGTGTVTVDGTTLTIVDRQPDRIVKIMFDTGTSAGKAKVKMLMPDGVVPFSIKSTNPNAVCSCAAR